MKLESMYDILTLEQKGAFTTKWGAVFEKIDGSDYLAATKFCEKCFVTNSRKFSALDSAIRSIVKTVVQQLCLEK